MYSTNSTAAHQKRHDRMFYFHFLYIKNKQVFFLKRDRGETVLLLLPCINPFVSGFILKIIIIFLSL